jgi:HEAT repeat protein
MQLKLIDGMNEVRAGLPKQFAEAVFKAQSSGENVVLERSWIAKGVRYGEVGEIQAQFVEELIAAYDAERLHQLVAKALTGTSGEEEGQLLSSDVIEAHLDDPNWEVRYAALERMKLTEQEIPLLKKALQDEKMSIRRLATAYLPEIGGSKAIQLLCEALKDKSAIVRRTAGDALSDIGDPRAIDSMIEALRDTSKLVRWRAARYLYELGDGTAVPALREAQNDPEFEVALQVKMALERMEAGEEAKGTVWQQMINRKR